MTANLPTSGTTHDPARTGPRPRGPVQTLVRRWKDGWIADLDAPGARRAAAIDMLVFDHGLIRKVWHNEAEVAPGVWRSNQPDPETIRRLGARGFRAILNLRGRTEWGSYLLERDACRAAGIALHDIKLAARRPPTRAELRELDRLFGTLPRPFLIHCKSGADRAGLASAVFLLTRGGTVAEAQAQLHWRFLHRRRGRTAILGRLIAAYAARTALTGIGFRDWVDQEYDPDSLRP